MASDPCNTRRPYFGKIEPSFNHGMTHREIFKMHPHTILENSSQLAKDGYVTLQGLYTASVIEDTRKCVTENISLLKNTRPNPSSGHLAGFHRYPELESLHTLISNHRVILGILKEASHSHTIRSIGLSDITVNRSQEWHVDLLRGKYCHHLNEEICWGVTGGGVYKVLWYLQDGKSLQVIPGAHTSAIGLENDQSSQPHGPGESKVISVKSGDIILMDIRLPHRGSSEEEMKHADYFKHPKILVSTVLGGQSKPLTEKKKKGNSERLSDWDVMHQNNCQLF